ncbi:hypothetical protein CLAIMM_00845 [Cladophialophora immunda]|nr:hypothetical protein CLAIMM_00845 [Cladophialophora immunda]
MRSFYIPSRSPTGPASLYIRSNGVFELALPVAKVGDYNAQLFNSTSSAVIRLSFAKRTAVGLTGIIKEGFSRDWNITDDVSVIHETPLDENTRMDIDPRTQLSLNSIQLRDRGHCPDHRLITRMDPLGLLSSLHLLQRLRGRAVLVHYIFHSTFPFRFYRFSTPNRRSETQYLHNAGAFECDLCNSEQAFEDLFAQFYANESLSIVAVNTDAGFMPGWLTASGDKVYSISRTNYPNSDSGSGGVFAFRRTPLLASAATGTGLVLLNRASSNGKGGVHCEVSPDGKILAAANITASTLSIYPLSEDGSIGTPTFVFDYNQSDPGPKEAHPHQATFDPSGQFLIVPLRTMDRVDIYYTQGPRQVEKVYSIHIPAPAGARHVAFNPISPSKAYMYLISEKDNSVRVFVLSYKARGPQGLTVEFKQRVSAMGKDLAPTPAEHKDLAAEIAVSNDGRFVYASNRNLTSADDDILTIYSVDADPAHDEHHLTYLESQSTRGKHPRMFALSNDKENKWVAIAHQFSQDIVVFERDVTTGLLGEVRGRISVKVEAPNQATPDKVTFVKGEEGRHSREEFKKGRIEGPMCVLWK